MPDFDVPPTEFDVYPAPSFVPAADVEDHMREDDVDTIIELRDLGVATIRGEYWGGHDRSNYELIGLYDKDGYEVTEDEDVKGFTKNLSRGDSPEIVAVDHAMGGPFNGAGVGQTYGGIIEMRLDTLETRKINEYYEEMHSHDHPRAAWDDDVESVS